MLKLQGCLMLVIAMGLGKYKIMNNIVNDCSDGHHKTTVHCSTLLQFIKTSPNINQTDFYFYSIATRFPGLLMVQLYFGKHELSTFNLC